MTNDYFQITNVKCVSLGIFRGGLRLQQLTPPYSLRRKTLDPALTDVEPGFIR